MKYEHKETKEKEDKILELYKAGIGVYRISLQTTSSKKTVKKVLLKHGIDSSEDLKSQKEEKYKQVLELYKQGKPQLEIEQTLKMTRKTIREILKSSEVEYRNKATQQKIRHKTEIDETVLDDLTKEEAAYWIGMYYADGYVKCKNEFMFSLCLHNDDFGHLQKAKRFFKSNREIIEGHGNCSVLNINSEKLHKIFRNIGFDNTKSYTARPPEELKDSPHFWRGVVDGDGCLSFLNKETPLLHLCGTKETIEDFIIFLKNNGLPTSANAIQVKGQVLHQVGFSTNNARIAASILYQDSTIYLERKYQKYLSFLN
jgi:regulator of replication initiation timing